MDFLSYVQLARRFWWLLLGGFVIGAAFGAIQVSQAPVEYRGSASFFLRTAGEGTSEANLGDQFAQRRINTYVALLGTDRTRQFLEDGGAELVRNGESVSISGSADLDTVLLTATVTASERSHALDVVTVLSEVLPQLVDDLENAGDASGPVQLVLVSGPSVRSVPTAGTTTVAVFAILGLAVAAVIAVVLTLTDRRIRAPGQLEQVAGVPLIGSLPRDRRAKQQPLVASVGAESPRAEAFRELRTNVKYLDLGARTQTLVVASAGNNEGRTTTAANLAVLLAQSGSEVLLVDGDLRNPMLDSMFGIEPGPGLADVLRGHVELGAASHLISPHLTLLPAGLGPFADAPELLESRKMDALLDTARTLFDFVIFDTPPLLGVTDAVLLSVRVDGVILVARVDATTVSEVEGAVGSLALVDARLIGVVASMTSTRRLKPIGAPARPTPGVVEQADPSPIMEPPLRSPSTRP